MEYELVGRSTELESLERAWRLASQGTPQLVAVWGRRRVGKTFLLSHFARGKPHIYFTATRQDSEQRQVDRLHLRVREQLGDRARLWELARPTEWEGALRLLIESSVAEPLLVIVDEMPRLLTGRSDFADLLSAVWENHVAGQQLMLVVTGSAVSSMESLLGADGGLRGRPDLQIRLDPFGARDARAFLADLAADQYVAAYAACGGYPLHLQRWQSEQSVEDNLLELAFAPGGILLTDAMDIMSEDLDWRSGYERVLSAISGATGVRRGKIASRANQRIDYTLGKLQQAGYVHAEQPIGSTQFGAPLYAISDTYLSFWFSVLRDDAELIEGGQGEAVLHRRTHRLNRHVSAIFEQMARDHTASLVRSGRLPADSVVGRWWKDEVTEIDVLALSGQIPVLAGEVKWESRALGHHELAALHRKLAHLPFDDVDPQLATWTRAGVDPDLSSGDLWSFTPSDMF